MKTSLVAGIRRVERVVVDESNSIDFLGEELRVYSTPSMVHDVEYARAGASSVSIWTRARRPSGSVWRWTTSARRRLVTAWRST